MGGEQRRVGAGVLFGLEKYRYEFAGLLMHAEHLEAVHGVGPHTISVPRTRRWRHRPIVMEQRSLPTCCLKKVIACIRIAVPPIPA